MAKKKNKEGQNSPVLWHKLYKCKVCNYVGIIDSVKFHDCGKYIKVKVEELK